MLFGLGVYLSLNRGACWCFLSGPWLDGGDNDDEVDGDCDDDSAVDSDDNDENEDENEEVSYPARWSFPFILEPLLWSSIFSKSREHTNIEQSNCT